jgi:hypothetical protein
MRTPRASASAPNDEPGAGGWSDDGGDVVEDIGLGCAGVAARLCTSRQRRIIACRRAGVVVGR